MEMDPRPLMLFGKKPGRETEVLLWIAVPFEHAVGSVWFVRVIENGLTHKPYASDGTFNVTCNP
jgi:hypothetical protein